MNVQSRLMIASLALVICTACATPDVVVRPGSKFTKTSSITLIAGSDPAIFKPELEKELIRQGFNVISDSVAQVVSQEKKSGDLKAAGTSVSEVASNGTTGKAGVKAQGDELTEKKVTTVMQSDYTGKIEYLYKPGKHTVSRLNFTVIELHTGTVVVSIGYEKGGKNLDIAREIALMLAKAVSN